jgi:hypothetical protein
VWELPSRGRNSKKDKRKDRNDGKTRKKTWQLLDDLQEGRIL